jgi:hypothetical protein
MLGLCWWKISADRPYRAGSIAALDKGEKSKLAGHETADEIDWSKRASASPLTKIIS